MWGYIVRDYQIAFGVPEFA